MDEKDIELQLVFPSKIRPSDSILATFTTRDGITHKFKVEGRGTSILGSTQGDHVTAYGLVERGIIRHLIDVKITKAEDLEELRQYREIILSYIASMVTINSRFESNIIELLKISMDQYNQRRYQKTRLMKLDQKVRDMNGIIQDDEFEKEIFNLIEHTYVENCYAMCDEIGQITRGFLTHYNHIPNTAFPKNSLIGLDGKIIIAPVGKEAKALNYLDNAPWNYIKEHSRDTHVKKMISQITDAINDLFFYPVIQEELHEENSMLIQNAQKLQEWQAKYTKISLPRTNDLDDLYQVVARHLFIVFSAYPELEKFEKDVVESFINKFIDAQWPSLKDKENFCSGVNAKITDFKEKAIGSNILNLQEIQSRRSSGDNEEEFESMKAESHVEKIQSKALTENTLSII